MFDTRSLLTGGKGIHQPSVKEEVSSNNQDQVSSNAVNDKFIQIIAEMDKA